MTPIHRVLFHVDMDAFYASVEQREVPRYQGRPVIVGASPQQRGVVCAASYEARAFGVRSAMPSVTAGKLCPQGIFVRPRMALYRQESKEVMAILQRLGAQIEQVSVDEAYLDLSEQVTGDDLDDALVNSVAIARNVREEIRQRRGLAASIGIASNKLLAKLASDYGKPDGLMLIPERDKVEFLRNLPVGRIHGVGQVTESLLKKAGLNTIADIQDFGGELRGIVGSWGDTLKQYALGEDHRPLSEDDTVKSMSCETTFSRDTEDRVILRKTLREQADELGLGLKKKRLRAKTIQVKVRYTNFETLTRQLSVTIPLDDGAQIYRSACHLLARDKLVKQPLRLLGLGVSGLVDADWAQLEFEFKKAAKVG
jgi:DNA polymerase IV